MLGIIILHYLTLEQTTQCIVSIQEQTTIPYHIYLVDHTPDKKDEKALQAFCNDKEQITLMYPGTNLGYARGNNYGIEAAKADKCDAILISNNDVRYQKKSIDYMYQTLMGQHQYQVLGPCLYEKDGMHILNSVKLHTPDFKEYFMNETYLKSLIPEEKRMKQRVADEEKEVDSFYQSQEPKFPPNPETLREVSWIAGSCFMVKTTAFSRIGGFDPFTFLYFEEYILAERFKNKKIHMAYCPEAKVLHYHGASIASLPNERIQLIHLESELYLLHRYWQWSHPKLHLILWMRCLEMYYSYRKTKEGKKVARNFKMQAKQIYAKELKATEKQ